MMKYHKGKRVPMSIQETEAHIKASRQPRGKKVVISVEDLMGRVSILEKEVNELRNGRG